LQGLDGFDDAKKGAVLSDYANRRNADLLVNPLAFVSEGYGNISKGLKTGSTGAESKTALLNAPSPA
jgi:hypothetical protein